MIELKDRKCDRCGASIGMFDGGAVYFFKWKQKGPYSVCDPCYLDIISLFEEPETTHIMSSEEPCQQLSKV